MNRKLPDFVVDVVLHLVWVAMLVYLVWLHTGCAASPARKVGLAVPSAPVAAVSPLTRRPTAASVVRSSVVAPPEPAPAPPTLTIEQTDEGVRLAWPAEDGKTYQLYASTDMATWYPVTLPLPAVTNPLRVTLFHPRQQFRAFSVRVFNREGVVE